MCTAFRYQTTQNLSILHELTTLSFSTSNSFPRRVISSDASHHKTLQHSGLRWLKCCSPASKEVGSVPKQTFLVTQVPRRSVSLLKEFRSHTTYFPFSRLFSFSSWKASYLHVPWFQTCGPQNDCSTFQGSS